MATRYSVFTRILGEDFASEAFRKVGNAARTAFGPVKAFNQAVASPSSSALGRVGAAADGVASRFRGGLSSISSWLPALGALGSALTLGGLISMTRKSAEGFDDLATSSEKLAVPTKWLSVMRYGAKQTNVETEALQKGFTKLRKNMFDAATGKNADVAALFTAMKIPLRDARGNIKGLEGSLDDIAEAFHNTGDEETKNAAALLLFGKSGADLIPFLNRGRAGLAAWRAEMAQFGGLTEAHKTSLGGLDTAYKRLDKAGSGLASRLSAAVAPGLTKVVGFTTNWIVANRELIAQSLERKIDALGKAFDFVSGAAQKVLAVPWIAEFTKGIDTSKAFDVGLGFLGLTMAGPVLSALGWVTKAVWTLNRAVLLNPFVAVAAAAAFAAYAIYENWGPITEWFGEQMTAIREAFDEGWGSGLWEIFTRFNAFNLIANAVNGLSKWLFDIDLFDAGKRILSRLMDGIRSLLPDFEKIWAPIERGLSWVSGGGVRSTDFSQQTADSYRAAYAERFPQAPSPGSPAAMASAGGSARNGGEVKVKVEFENTPQGARVSIDGQGVKIERSVGYSMQDNT